MSAFPGRLNLFQATMLDWRDLHPYNAVHAVHIERPFDRDALTAAIDAELVASGLTGLELDRKRNRYAWRGGPARTRVELLDAGPDWRRTIAAAFERQLNAPFPDEGRMDPFRFFAVPTDAGFFVGLGYDHFIAGGDSIVVLLNGIALRFAGPSGATAETPPQRYPRTHWRLFAHHPLKFARGVLRLPSMAASCRRTVRPHYRALEDGHVGFSFFTLGPAEYQRLRAAAKAWRVTLNDALMAVLLLVQDAQLPGRNRTQRRHELAVASIMNLRDAHGDDPRATFGQFLSSFRVSHPVPPSITLEALAQAVHRETSRIKREKLFLTTLFAMAVDRIVGRFQSREQRLSVYAKNYPVGAGVSSLNVGASWRTTDGSAAPMYIRGVPTGPLSPFVLAVTTSGDMLCAGITYRTTASTARDIEKIQADIVGRIHALT